MLTGVVAFAMIAKAVAAKTDEGPDISAEREAVY